MRASGINRAFMQARSLSAGPVIAASSAAGMPSGSESNAHLASGACAMALPASAPARIVAKNSARSISKENVDIEHRPFLSTRNPHHIGLRNFRMKLVRVSTKPLGAPSRTRYDAKSRLHRRQRPERRNDREQV